MRTLGFSTSCASAPTDLGRSVDELRALGEVSQAVNSTLELETVLSTIVANAVQLSGTEAGAIYVFDELQRALRLRATYGMDRELIDALTQQTIGMNEPYVAAVFAEREPVQIPDLQEGVPSPVNEVIMRAGFRAVLVTPLIRGEEIVGLLVVRRRSPGGLRAEHRRFDQDFRGAISRRTRERAAVQRRRSLAGGFADHAGSARPNTEACLTRPAYRRDRTRDQEPTQLR